MVDLEKTLLDLCTPLVDDKNSLSVKTMSSTNENEVLLYVYANSEDVARLIGRGFNGKQYTSDDVNCCKRNSLRFCEIETY